MDVEAARLIRFDGSSEKWEVFEDVSKGRDKIEDGFRYRVVRLGHRWEEVVDGGPDEGNDKVQSVYLYGVWAGETEPGGGSDPDCSKDRLGHAVAEGEGGGDGRVRGSQFMALNMQQTNPFGTARGNAHAEI